MNTGDMVLILIVSLIMTIILELMVFLICRQSAWSMRDGTDLLLVIMVNVITNPSVVLLYYLAASYMSNVLIPVVLGLEATAVVVEGLYYRYYGRNFIRPFVFSFCANLFSYGTGLLINLL